MADDENQDDDGLGTDEETTEEAETEATQDNSTAGITPAEMARNRLRKANKHENTGSVTLVGDPGLVAGLTVELLNFGSFNGKYIASKTVHKISNGYDIEVELRRVLNGY
jgi:nucleoid DNA-binding protein